MTRAGTFCDIVLRLFLVSPNECHVVPWGRQYYQRTAIFSFFSPLFTTYTPAHCCLLWQKNRKPSRCGERYALSVTSWRLDCHLCVSFLLMSESFPGIRGICLQMQSCCHDIYEIANEISCILFFLGIYLCVVMSFPLSSSIMSAICKSLLSITSCYSLCAHVSRIG